MAFNPYKKMIQKMMKAGFLSSEMILTIITYQMAVR